MDDLARLSLKRETLFCTLYFISVAFSARPFYWNALLFLFLLCYEVDTNTGINTYGRECARLLSSNSGELF